ncbi:MAG: bifunctional adenosylcobinamide kinase/adenosylcobinamide-phosphate guanylyltransferase [Epsilonproteobacteria bacterium]|nr:bifunctional adenosylcobinamide kinase/adenosylcobinamide-phosphate guanylyltransferase [Campylobacterota bacterium]
MKVLYFGGQKSGKSSLAERHAKELSTHQPYYLATYDNRFGDTEMQNRIEKHRDTRKEDFITIEESRDLASVLQPNHTYLIDCISMWLLNRIEEDEAVLIHAIEELEHIDANIVFVLNDVSCGVIPIDAMSRRYVDLGGLIGQKLASICDEVYEVKLGLRIRLK